MSITVTLQPTDDIQNYATIVTQNGGGIIYLTPGTYFPTSDITISENVSLIGLSRDATIIDFQNSPYSVRSDGANVYNTGTVDVTDASITVIGTGTNWTLDMIGRTLFVGGSFYEIADVVDTTTITLASAYSGDTLIGTTYVIATPSFDVFFQNFTVQNSTVSGVVMKYNYYSNLDGVNVYNCDIGVEFDTTVGVAAMTQGFIIDSCNIGLQYTNSTSWTIDNSSASNCVSHGMSFINSGDAVLRDSGLINNGGDGIRGVGASGISIHDITISANTGNAIGFVSECSENQIYSMLLKNNGAYGIELADSTNENNIIGFNFFEANTSGAVNDNGTSTLIRSNLGVADN